MAWFESGRSARVNYDFTLTVHYAEPTPTPSPGHPRVAGVATATGPTFKVSLVSQVFDHGSEYSLFVLMVEFLTATTPYSHVLYSTRGGHPNPFDETMSVDVRISIP